ncbi:Oidioi.mRNA.OKI2018_I69.chr1.g450.t1.cds [Oikopleura dioica]|uniref:Oidioi.mRNA.OKI2018_I69.chr1.g450.t1.cds n=1 Tax=Oikopleura dioica TaxID=34765 RepID=A0ABN7SJW2_OIKDI|nr:Oidioi.mRNA.OKI2018_I69.chr1.g450.t1.cds [Oikopleura dioica]
MGFAARLLDRDFADSVICYLCKEVLEDVVALACCEEHCCRKCYDSKKRGNEECVCGQNVVDHIEDRPMKNELAEAGDFECTKCFAKPLRYDLLPRHMKDDCARRTVYCRHCERHHGADYVESCAKNTDAAAIHRERARLEREAALSKKRMEDAIKSEHEAKMKIEEVQQREDILQTRFNQQKEQLRQTEQQANRIMIAQHQERLNNPPPPNERIVTRPLRYGPNVGTNFVRKQIPWQNDFKKLTFGWIQNRFGKPIAPEKRELMINREDTVRSVRDKIRAQCKIEWPRQLFYNGITDRNSKLINNIDPIKEIDDITVGADGILWIGRSNIWDDEQFLEDQKNAASYRY